MSDQDEVGPETRGSRLSDAAPYLMGLFLALILQSAVSGYVSFVYRPSPDRAVSDWGSLISGASDLFSLETAQLLVFALLVARFYWARTGFIKRVLDHPLPCRLSQ